MLHIILMSMNSKFFKKASLLLAAGILLAFPKAMAQQTVNNVPDVTLNNGMKMPQLGFGTWTVVNDPTGVISEAIRAGFRHFDTAQMYGNEAGVGQAVRESGIARSEFFITTKISTVAMREGTVRESLDKSLEVLGDGYIDLVLLHWPVKGHIKEAWQILEEYVRNGKVKAIGLSNFNPSHYEELMSYAEIKPVLNQIEIHPTFSNEANAEYFKKAGVAVQSWSPLGSGKDLGDETIAAIGRKYGKSPAQVILRWHIQRGLLTIPRTEKRSEMDEDINIFDFELSAEDMAAINALNKNQRTNAKNDPDNFPW